MYIGNGANWGTETANVTQHVVPRAPSGYTWSFYRHNKNRYMQQVNADQARKLKKYDIFFTTKYTKPPAHMHAISDSHCNVTHSARERQHHSCRVKWPTNSDMLNNKPLPSGIKKVEKITISYGFFKHFCHGMKSPKNTFDYRTQCFWHTKETYHHLMSRKQGWWEG